MSSFAVIMLCVWYIALRFQNLDHKAERKPLLQGSWDINSTEGPLFSHLAHQSSRRLPGFVVTLLLLKWLRLTLCIISGFLPSPWYLGERTILCLTRYLLHDKLPSWASGCCPHRVNEVPEALLFWFYSSSSVPSFTGCSWQLFYFLTPTKFSIILKYVYMHLLKTRIFHFGFFAYNFWFESTPYAAFLICFVQALCMLFPSTASLPEKNRDAMLSRKGFLHWDYRTHRAL